jgi:hypothetical protein
VTSPTSPTEYTADPPTILEREIPFKLNVIYMIYIHLYTAVHSTAVPIGIYVIFRHTRTVPTYLFCVVGSNDGAHRVYIRP